MASAFNKEVLRTIAQSLGRFIAIAIISLLGAGFYGGLRMGAPDMRIAGDEFFDGTNLYDISVMTSLGVDEETARLVRETESVEEVMLAKKADAMVVVGESSYAASIESSPVEAARESDTSDGVCALSDDPSYLNRPILTEGEWPSREDECVISFDAAAELGVAIGDTISVEKTESEVDDVFEVSSFKVTGFVNSPAYASTGILGTTDLGTGSLELYAYVSGKAFADDYAYTAVYATVQGARELQWGTEAYDRAVEAVAVRIKEQAPTIADDRREAVKDAIHMELLGAFQEMSVSLDWADDVELPDVFVVDRSKNAGVASLDSDADGIAQIASVFPFMFFLVAALVSLTSMTRMVDEERMVIGTHKALGYGKGRITSKYLVYGALASGVGSIVGVVLLGKILPWFIMTSYGVTYAIPVFPTPIEPATAAKAIGLSIGVTAIATWGAASSSLRERPASLMLPRTPKAGKRIFLEHVKPLWERMSFSHKVTARNLLRYKRRFFMAVVGIAGCTALLMIGFGLRDAIGGIVANQYEELVNYNAAVRMDEDASKNARMDVEQALDSPDVEAYLEVADFNMIAQGADDEMRIEVVVPSDPSALSSFVTLRDRVSGEAVAPSGDGIVLTEKAANELGVKVGDVVELFDENMVGDPVGDARRFTVCGIAENYLGHYAYLTPSGYESAFGEAPDSSLMFVKLAPDADGSAFSERLLSLKDVNTVSFVQDKITTYEDMLGVMNKLIYVVVLAAAALAFVVLYNLTNINISERIREIATLKVLGFTRSEVSAYIFREIIVMALIGALVGCVIGVPLTGYIAQAAETPQMMFGRTIEPLSFVFSFALTMVFSAFVAFTMRGKLARVNMVESLKSVD